MTTRRIKELEEIIDILMNYDGYNPLLQRLRAGFITNKAFSITDTQKKYVKLYHDFEPKPLNKIVEFTPYFGEQLKEQFKLEFVPEKMHVYYYLGSTDHSHHVLGKVRQNQEPTEYFVPKKQILGDLLYEIREVDIDYEKYNKLLSKFGRQVLPHMPEGIEFLLNRDKSILADGMGMCKTAESIIAAIEGEFEKILIICPASLKINWSRELQLLSVPEEDIAIIRGNKWIEGKKYTIINYDILDNFYQYIDGRKKKDIAEMLENSPIYKANFDLLIADEAHFLSNSKSNRSKIVSDLVSRCEIDHRWLLTGTPMTNRPINYYNLLRTLDVPVADDWRFYILRYCAGKQITNRHSGKKIWLTDGASNLGELRDKTKHIRLKRKIEDYVDMPDKIITPQFYELSSSQRSQYTQLYDEYIDQKLASDLGKYMAKHNITDQDEARTAFVNDMDELRDLVETMVLRKYVAMEMLPNTFELIDIALDAGEKVIVFCNFTDELMEIHEKYKNVSVVHYGEMDLNEKQASVDRFQNDDSCKIFIGNLVSAGVGITLTEGDIEIFNSMSWVPGVNEQALCRAWRTGREGTVKIYYNLFSNTITEQIYMDNLEKQANIDQVID